VPGSGLVHCGPVGPSSGEVLQRGEGRVLFGKDPKGYDTGRPDYPERIYEILTDRCGLRPGTRILEVGPGTGLVTRRLLAAGASVTAVEPDPGLAGYLARQCPGVEVLAAPLEEAAIGRVAFDLALAATSFHWVDQRLGLTKLGESLKPGGWVALWWTLFRDPWSPDPFSQAVEELLGPATRGAFDEPDRPPFQLDEEHRLRDLARWAGLIGLEAELLRSEAVLDSGQARALYASMATVLRRPEAEQQHILDAIERLASERFGGTVRRRFLTALYTGHRP
jgi:SAM-dependent methyltransferase